MKGTSQVYRLIELRNALMRETCPSIEVLRGMLIIALDILSQQQAQLEVMRAVAETLEDLRNNRTVINALQ